MKTDHTDATGDYGYKLKEAEDALYREIMDAVYVKPEAVVTIGEASIDAASILFDATDLSNVPSGIDMARFVMQQAQQGNLEARQMVAKLAAKYAWLNAECAE